LADAAAHQGRPIGGHVGRLRGTGLPTGWT
jgi:hypothetical protein